DEDSNVHLPLRQRPGLVGADDARGAQGFHRGELSDQRAPTDHALQAQREADRDDGREAFRDRGDREADRREEQELDVSWVPEDADAEDQARRGKDGDPGLTPEAVELLLERRLLLRLLRDGTVTTPPSRST